jgi:3-deoxy-D-manno-octulosonic-acid transferase
LLIRSLGNPAYSLRWKERFGYLQNLQHEHPLIWIHAVSVGEVRAAKPLVDALRREYPGFQIMITTMTPTGAETVFHLFGDRVIHRYIPYDLPGAVRRFIKATSPGLLMVMETELWPNLFHYCRVFNVPVILVNGRMSAQSAGRYRLAAALTRSTLGNLLLICAQGREDAERFISLGASNEKVLETGNLKYDFTLPEDLQIKLEVIRQNWSSTRPVWMAASTHAGEEAAILTTHARILDEFPDCLLIIAPRHPERCSEIARLCEKSGFRFVQKTTRASPDESMQVFILDTLGELIYYYALSRLAFVGGSLVRIGGHNMLEPASLGIPVIYGPYFYNFYEIGRLLQKAGAARVINDPCELANEVIRLLSNEKLRHDAGQCGRQVVEENRGSIDRVWDRVRPLLNQYATNLKKSV